MTPVPLVLGHMQRYTSTETHDDGRIAGTTQNPRTSAWRYDHAVQTLDVIRWLASISGWIMDEAL